MARWRPVALVSVVLGAAAGSIFFPSACFNPAGEIKVAPAFELPDLGGGRLSLASLKGKIVVLDFWATWCGPCIREMPDYDAFWRKNRARGVEVVGVVLESGDPQTIQDFVREHRVPYRQVLGSREMQEAYGATQGLPTTFVIDAQGMIRSTTMGSNARKFEILQETVDTLLNQ